MRKNFLSLFAVLALAACSSQPANTEKQESSNDSVAVESSIQNSEETTQPAAVEETVEASSTEESNGEWTPKHLTNQGEEYERLKNNKWKVEGKVSVKNFINALYLGTDYAVKYPEDAKELQNEEGFFECDEKNGYAIHSEEGAGGYQFACCYWKTTDGKILVALSSHSHDCVERTVYDCSSFLLFFNYNTDTHLLEPIQQPFNLNIANPNHLRVALPQKGTDIQLDLCERKTCDFGMDYNYLLKWNGKGFDVVKQSATDDLESWTKVTKADDRDRLSQKSFTWPDEFINDNNWRCPDEAVADYIRDCVFSSPLLIKADELTQYKRVRKTKVEKTDSYQYEYFKCGFSWEGKNMTVTKDSGSQRFVGTINRIDERMLSYAGCWYHTDEQPQGYGNNDHSEVGFIKKIEKDKIIMIVPQNDHFDILEFAK